MNTNLSVRSSVLAGLLVLAAAGSAHAQSIGLTGDLGPGSFTGIAISPINSSFTQPFSQSTAAGSITGDVIVASNVTGTVFDLTITNLAYTCLIPNSSFAGDVTVTVQHSYATTSPGIFTGSQALSGSFTSGPFSFVQLDSIQDFNVSNVPLPTLLATTPSFNLGPVSANISTLGTTTATYDILATLVLHTDLTGTIALPSSAHIHVEMIPAPGAAGLLGLAGLVATRRRRS